MPLVSACAGVAQLMGRFDEARERLEKTLHALPDPTSNEAVTLLVDLGVASAYAMELERAREYGERALTFARPLGDAPLTAAAAGLCAVTMALAAEAGEADRYRAEAAGLVDAVDDQALARRLDAVAHLSSAEGYLDRYEEAVAHAERGFAVARATAQGHLFPALFPAINTPLCALGRHGEAAELLDGAIEGARLTGNPQPLAWNLQCMAVAYLAAGNIDGALAAIAESVELAGGIELSVVSIYCGVMDGVILIAAGQAEQGVTTLGRGGRCGDRPAAVRSSGQSCAGARRARRRRRRDRSRARTRLGGGRRRTRRTHRVRTVAHARRARARGDRRGGPGCRAVRARGGRMRRLRRAGLPRRGRARARQARPAPSPAHAPGQTDGVGVESLTERELQIARLVVDRKTNTQIAAELYLSPKTIEAHMRNVFHKLGVSSRVDVARTVERADRHG